MDDPQLAFRFTHARTCAQSPRIHTSRVRVELVRDATPPTSAPLRNSTDLYALLRDEAAGWDRERFVSVMLDNKHRVLGIEEVSVGTLTSALVHPRLCAAAHKRGYVAAAVM